MPSKEQLLNKYTELKTALGEIVAYIDKTNKDPELSNTGKAGRVERFIEQSGISAKRDAVVSALGEYADQLQEREHERVIGYLTDNEHQQFLDKALDAIGNGLIDEPTAAAIVEQFNSDPVAIARITKAMTKDGATITELPAAPKMPNFDAMAQTLKNELTPATVKTNGVVLSMMLDEHQRNIARAE